jgi:hypothetical protein
MNRITLLFLSLGLLVPLACTGVEQEYEIRISSFDYDCQTITMDVDYNDSIIVIKRELQTTTGVPVADQELTIQGNVVSNRDLIGKWVDLIERRIPFQFSSKSGEPVSVKYGYGDGSNSCYQEDNTQSPHPEKSRVFLND